MGCLHRERGRRVIRVKLHQSLALGFVLAAFRMTAATTIMPASPTSQDIITAAIDVSSSTSYDIPSTAVIGNVIRTNLTVIGYVAGPPPVTGQLFVNFGPLPAGSYTYHVYTIENALPVLLSQQTIVVAPTAIPTINNVSLCVLALSLCAVACLALGHPR